MSRNEDDPSSGAEELGPIDLLGFWPRAASLGDPTRHSGSFDCGPKVNTAFEFNVGTFVFNEESQRSIWDETIGAHMPREQSREPDVWGVVVFSDFRCAHSVVRSPITCGLGRRAAVRLQGVRVAPMAGRITTARQKEARRLRARCAENISCEQHR